MPSEGSNDENVATSSVDEDESAGSSKSSAKSTLRKKYDALLESRNKYKDEADESKRAVLALEQRVVDLEAELASPTNPRNLAIELAEAKGEVQSLTAALLREKNRSAKNEGRAERVVKLERDNMELLRDVESLTKSRRRDQMTYAALGALFGAGAAVSTCAYYLKHHRA